MDVTYNASSASKRAEIVRALQAEGYKTTTSGPARVAFQLPVRVWRVAEADEQAVIDSILAIDPLAEPVLPPPAYISS